MDSAVVALVRSRAGFVCEYCRIPESFHPWPFEIEHIIAEQHGGRSTPSNLAYACLQCNRHKGPNLAGIDWPTSRTRLVRLFNPRQHKWRHNFIWDGARILGRTPIGRVTVRVLALNDPVRVQLRAQLLAEGVFPPDE